MKPGREVRNAAGVAVLRGTSLRFYPAGHRVTVYEATHDAAGRGSIERCRLDGLAEAGVSALWVLFVPAFGDAPFDTETACRLGLDPATAVSRSM